MIYLDYSATTPVDKKVAREMEKYLYHIFANPSSVHRAGTSALIVIDKAKDTISNYLKCQSDEIYFTSGATESNNLAIQGTIKYYRSKSGKKPPHIITTSIEHPSVLEVCKYLEKTRQAEITYIRPDSNSIINAEDIEKHIKENTVLVSVMYVNNETGAVQPVKKIGKIIAKHNKNRKIPIYFHIDAVQAFLYFDVKPMHLKADLVSFSAHKIYGPKGIGMLYKQEGIAIDPLMHGGSQQKGIRPGTLPVHLIAGFAKAVEVLSSRKEKDIQKVADLKKLLIQKLKEKIPDIIINGDVNLLSPAIVNIYFPNIDPEAFMTALDLEGVYISRGSACAAGAIYPSSVLRSLGYDKERVQNSFRFSLGRYTTKSEIIQAVDIIAKNYNKLLS